ncbi:MAG: GNAT family N-acetyltransferase [Pseudonocardia sp.]|nr:GNAT family N-acetyltransferase [Pseudonocardia sp.]
MTSAAFRTPNVDLRPNDPVIAVDPRTDARWDRLSRTRLGSLFTSAPWIRAVCDTYGYAPEARIACDAAQEPIAGVAFVDLDDIRGLRRSSLPFSDRADPVILDSRVWAELAGNVAEDSIPWSMRCVEGTVPTAELGPLTVTSRAALHRTSVESGLDDVRGRLGPAARRNLRAGKAHGVVVRASTDMDAVRQFHAMHVDLRRRKYRMLAQPVTFFERLWQEFEPQGSVVILTAFLDGEPAAGALFLVWQDTLYYKFGASFPDRLWARPNDALFWTAIEWASERELRTIDWGLSDLDQPGLLAYKRKWASIESRIVRLSSTDSMPTNIEVDRVLSDISALLTCEGVPTEVTERAGSLLYRYFS